MRANSIQTIDDARIAIQDLQNWQSLIQTKPLDYHGLRITNAGNSVDPQDYVTRAELTNQYGTAPAAAQHYTQVFNLAAVANDGDKSPPFVVQVGREGIPTSVWVASTIPPPDGDFIADVYVNGNKLLTSPIALPQGSSLVISSSQFVNPAPTLGTLTKVWIEVVSGGGASLIAIGLVVKRIS